MGADGKSDTRQIIIELKNKSTTLNSASKKGTISNIKELQKEYPNYHCIIGFINDDSNTNIIGDKYHKEIQEKVKEIVSSFYDKKK